MDGGTFILILVIAIIFLMSSKSSATTVNSLTPVNTPKQPIPTVSVPDSNQTGNTPESIIYNVAQAVFSIFGKSQPDVITNTSSNNSPNPNITADGSNVSDNTSITSSPDTGIILPPYSFDADGGSSGGDLNPPDIGLQDTNNSDDSIMGQLTNTILSFQPVVAQMSTQGQSGGGVDRWNDFIKKYADLTGVDPYLIKALIATESSGYALAINPVAKNLVTAKQLRSEILLSDDGFDVMMKYAINGKPLDPSIGLMQVRLSTANDVVKGISPKQMFDGETNIAVGCRHVSNIMRQGVTVDTIDAYNMGVGNLRKGRRNMNYLNKVKGYMAQFIDTGVFDS